MDEPRILSEQTRTLADARFIKLYDLAFEDGAHYFEASRREPEDILAFKSDDELRTALPDAVSCCLVLAPVGEEPRMVCNKEYRYPTGQFLLSIPSGLIDERDRTEARPLEVAMTREIGEECGIDLAEGDSLGVVNPFLFCTPGLTDESTALLCAVVRSVGAEALTQKGAEGTELFDGFVLLNEEQAWEVIRSGRDTEGRFYPMVCWTALMWFATGQWRATDGTALAASEHPR